MFWKNKIEFNLRNAIFSEEPVKIFEIGNVFSKEGESTRLCIGIGYKTKKLNKSKKILEEALSSLFSNLGITEKLAPKNLIEKETYTIFEFEFIVFEMGFVICDIFFFGAFFGCYDNSDACLCEYDLNRFVI